MRRAHPIRRAQIALARRVLGDAAVLADHPGERPARVLHALLQQRQPLHERLRPWRTARHVDVHRQELVRALHHAVHVEHAAGVGAGAHRDHPARFQQLFVEVLQHRRHLAEHGAGNDDQIRLAGRGANHLGAEAGKIVARGERRGHFHVAAGKAEVERPDGVGAPPGHQILQLGGEEALARFFVVGVFHRLHGRIRLGLDEAPLHGQAASGPATARA